MAIIYLNNNKTHTYTDVDTNSLEYQFHIMMKSKEVVKSNTGKNTKILIFTILLAIVAISSDCIAKYNLKCSEK